METKTLLEIIRLGLDVYSLISLLIGIGIGLGIGMAFIVFFLKKEWGLFINRRRPIMIFKSEDQNMGIAFNLLSDSKLFKIETPTENYQDSVRLNKHSLVIVGYTKKMQGLKNIIDEAKNRRVPVIIYAKPSEIDQEDMKILEAYSYHSICNTPLRLVNDVFTILSTYPNKKL